MTKQSINSLTLYAKGIMNTSTNFEKHVVRVVHVMALSKIKQEDVEWIHLAQDRA
jgi:hypothetical protein